MRPQRGLRAPLLGLGATALRHARGVLRPLLRPQLLPAGVHGGERPQPHPGQAAHGRARAAARGLRPGPGRRPRGPRAPPRRRHRPLRRGAAARDRSATPTFASAASSTRARPIPARTRSGRRRSRRSSRRSVSRCRSGRDAFPRAPGGLSEGFSQRPLLLASTGFPLCSAHAQRHPHHHRGHHREDLRRGERRAREPALDRAPHARRAATSRRRVSRCSS